MLDVSCLVLGGVGACDGMWAGSWKFEISLQLPEWD